MPGWLWVAALLALAALAAVVRFRLLVHAGGVLGSDGYDDGVYYAAADALVHGRLPYRDFLLLQPPGTVLALTPFAWFGSVTSDPSGEVAARLAFIGIGAIDTVLVATLARRFGAMAALLAGAGYAVFFPAAYAERSTLLEPLGTCALLVSVLLATRAARRPGLGMLIAGAAGGLALSTRIWFVVPLALIALAQRRGVLAYLAGAAAAGLAVLLPFFATDPSAMIRQVVLDQLGRPSGAAGSSLQRLDMIVGAFTLHLPQPWSAVLSPHKLGAVLAVGLVALGVAALTVPGARLFPVIAAATTAVLLVSPSFFLHYASFTAPWLVLSASIGATRLLRPARARPVAIIVGVLVLVGFVGMNLRVVQVARASSPIPVAALRPAAQRVRGCVLSDDPQTLIALDVLSRDYRLGCTVWPDVTGYTYDRDAVDLDGRVTHRAQNSRWQADVSRYLLSGDAVIVHRAATALAPATARRVRSGPILAKSGSWTLHGVQRSAGR